MSECKTCKVELVDDNNTFCSLGCYHQSLVSIPAEFRNRVCKNCGINFISKQKSKKQILLNNFCCKKCRYDYQGKAQKTGFIKRCKNCNIEFYTKKCNNYNFCGRECWYEYSKGKYNPNFSISRAKLVASGKVNPKRNYYKQGWVMNKSTNEEEYFASSYEERRMNQLNELGVIWTKNHRIRIPYKDEVGNTRNYVPDFLIDGRIIEEIKPKSLINSKMDNNCYKVEAAIEFCKNNGYEYRIISEEELKIGKYNNLNN